MIAIIFGLAAIAMGSYGMMVWQGECFVVLKWLISAGCIFGGMIAVLAGISSLRK